MRFLRDRRGLRWLGAAAVAAALGSVPAGRANAAGDPPGAILVVTSPAACPGAPGTLVEYERSIGAQVDAAAAQLGRTPQRIATRAALLEALRRAEGGWLLLFISGPGLGDGAGSKVCIGQADQPGQWLDINREVLPALSVSLSGR